MAQDDPVSPSDKGKEKIVNSDHGSAGIEKAKDGKPQVNGKKEDEKLNRECAKCFVCMKLLLTLCRFAVGPEELSEEDQTLKNELDMLVERLQVRVSVVRPPSPLLTKEPSGERHILVQASVRSDEELYQDVNIVHDGSTEAPKVPPTTLSDLDEALR
jgi:hypothetical protein